MKHLVLPCHWSQRSTVAADLVRCYGALGRTIIFCDTKRDCNELVGSLGEAMRARALHGDIPQQQREVCSLSPAMHFKFRLFYREMYSHIVCIYIWAT